MYDQYKIEFDWYFGINDGKGKLFAEGYMKDAIEYLQQRVRCTTISTSERYEVQDIVNGLFNLRNAIMEAEEITEKEVE